MDVSIIKDQRSVRRNKQMKNEVTSISTNTPFYNTHFFSILKYVTVFDQIKKKVKNLTFINITISSNNMKKIYLNLIILNIKKYVI